MKVKSNVIAGQFPKTDTGSAVIVGAGTSDTVRKNAIEITQDGKLYVMGAGGYNGTNIGGTDVKPISSVGKLAEFKDTFSSNVGYGTDGSRLAGYTVGKGSVTFGTGNQATASYAIATGNGSRATGVGGCAYGFQSVASGECSHAEGHMTYAKGDSSHAEGYMTVTTASNVGEHAQGKYNATHVGTIDSVGIGENASPTPHYKNATETMSDGRHFILGVGGYDGTNPNDSGVKDIAAELKEYKKADSTIQIDYLSNDGWNGSCHNIRCYDDVCWSDYDIIFFNAGNVGGWSCVKAVPTKYINNGYITSIGNRWGSTNAYDNDIAAALAARRDGVKYPNQDITMAKTGSESTRNSVAGGFTGLKASFKEVIFNTTNYSSATKGNRTFDIRLSDFDFLAITFVVTSSVISTATFVQVPLIVPLAEIKDGGTLTTLVDNRHISGTGTSDDDRTVDVSADSTKTKITITMNSNLASKLAIVDVTGYRLVEPEVIFSRSSVTDRTNYALSRAGIKFADYDFLSFSYKEGTKYRSFLFPTQNGMMTTNDGNASDGTAIFAGTGTNKWYMVCSNTLNENQINFLSSNVTLSNIVVRGYKGARRDDISPLAGKVLSVFGDSITTWTGAQPVTTWKGNDMYPKYSDYMKDGCNAPIETPSQTWWGQFIARDRMIRNSIVGYGASSTWDGTSVTRDFCGCSQARINQLNTQGTLVGTPNIIIAMFGQNDFQVSSSYSPLNPYTTTLPSDTNCKNGDQTASWYLMVYRCKQTYPDALMFVVLPAENHGRSSAYPMVQNGVSWKKWLDDVEKTVIAAGAIPIRLDKCSRINWTNSNKSTLGAADTDERICYVDVHHPNALGMRYIYEYVRSQIISYMNK